LSRKIKIPQPMTRKKIFVRDLEPGQNVSEVFALTEAVKGQAKNGPYWSMTLSDNSGEVQAKIFHPHSRECPRLVSGQMVLVQGRVGLYRDRPQIVAERVTIIDPDADGLDMGDFVQTGEKDPHEALAEIKALCKKTLTHKPWLNLCQSVLGDANIQKKLLMAPGGKTIHHAYAGGLLEHTLSVCRLCMGLCDLYPALDREILLTAAALHDLGKAWEYSDGPVREYTDPGRLLGHIQIGLQILEPFLEKARGLDPELILHFKHILLSHHGEYEFGSPKRPKTAEAFALHYADMLDSKLNAVAGAYEDMDFEGTGWSPYQRALERFLYRPAQTPGTGRHSKQEKENKQCSLPLKA